MKTLERTALRVVPLGQSIAADVLDIDLSQPLDAATFDSLFDAWMRHLVLRFRGQHFFMRRK